MCIHVNMPFIYFTCNIEISEDDSLRKWIKRTDVQRKHFGSQISLISNIVNVTKIR